MLDKRYFMQTDRASSGRASRGLLLAAVLACGGCASGADYERPRLAAPERFLGESAVQSRQATRPADPASWRSEEHTSELQSLMRISYAVFCLKKKKKQQH